MFYKRLREYKSNKGQSRVFDEVVPEKVTLRKNLTDTLLGSRKAYIVDRSAEASNGLHNTPFKEVMIAPFESVISSGMQEIIDMGDVHPQVIPKEEYAQKIFMAFKAAIKRHWNPSKFKIITHSSGSDSRLISTAIKHLHNELGDEWLGDILFVEAGGEFEGFLEIMKVQEWKPSQYAVYSNKKCPNENADRSLVFKDAWKKLNGVLGFPVNEIGWTDPVLWAQDQGLAPKDVQCWTGYGSNEISKALWDPEQNMGSYFKAQYYHELACFPEPCDTIRPFHDLEFIKEFMKWVDSDNPMDYPSVTVSKKIVPYIAPELSHINKDIDKIEDLNGYRNVSRRIMARNWANYMESWFGKNVDPDIEPTSKIEYSEWWGKWCLASFCQHLIETGHEIAIES